MPVYQRGHDLYLSISGTSEDLTIQENVKSALLLCPEVSCLGARASLPARMLPVSKAWRYSFGAD